MAERRLGHLLRLLRPDARQVAAEGSVVRSAMARFTIMSLACLLVLGIVSVALAGNIARAVSINSAREHTLSFARAVAAPLLDAEVRASPELTPLDTALHFRLDDGSIRHAVVYAQDGTIIWSADHSITGRGIKAPLSTEVQDLFTQGGTIAHLEEVTHAGGPGAQTPTPVLEVYAGAADADGVPFVLEWYLPTSDIERDQADVVRRLLPLTLGSLVLFQLLVLPLTLSTARRVEQERLRRTEYALKFSRIDRRRLSEALHDGVVQDLSGIGYVLPIISKDLPSESAGRELLAEVGRAMQRNTSAIRGLIADFRPVDMSGPGFREACEALAARTGEQGVSTTVRVAGPVDTLNETALGLGYRIAREGLRNVVLHSGGATARLEVVLDNPWLRVSVVDDGTGPAGDGGQVLRSSVQRGSDGDSHFGLALIEEALAAVGGRLELRRADGGGAELLAEFRPDRV